MIINEVLCPSPCNSKYETRNDGPARYCRLSDSMSYEADRSIFASLTDISSLRGVDHLTHDTAILVDVIHAENSG